MPRRPNPQILLRVAASLLLLAAGRPCLAAGETVASSLRASLQGEERGNYQEALNAALKALRQDPTSYLGNLRAGWLFYQLRQYPESVERYRRAHELAPRSLEPRLGLMLPLMAQRQWKEVEELGLHLLRFAPRNYTLLSRLAFVYFSTGRYSEAEQYYSEALTLFPSENEMKLGLAWTYLRMGRKREATAWFEQVLQLIPESLSARQGLDMLRSPRTNQG